MRVLCVVLASCARTRRARAGARQVLLLGDSCTLGRCAAKAPSLEHTPTSAQPQNQLNHDTRCFKASLVFAQCVGDMGGLRLGGRRRLRDMYESLSDCLVLSTDSPAPRAERLINSL